MKNTAIVLAGGRGSRMQSDIPKQYMEIEGRTVLFYSLKQFQDCSLIGEIVLVAGRDDVEFCKKTYIEEHNLTKIKKIVCGGKERYESVMNGLMAVDEGYVFIHDGARPMITQDIIARLKNVVVKEETAVAGMPVKDTIKVVDDENYVTDTPERQYVWQVQTPQCFSFPLIYDAYKSIIQDEEEGWTVPKITDDAMVLEYATDHEVKMVEADYRNIKITTPEDLLISAVFLGNK